MNERQQEIAALIKEGKTNKEIIAEASCSSATVSAVRKLLAEGAPQEQAAPPPKEKTSALKERVTELEEERDAYQQRVLDLLEHVAVLSMENVRLAQLAREAQEA